MKGFANAMAAAGGKHQDRLILQGMHEPSEVDMGEIVTLLDLTEVPESRWQGMALPVLRELAPGAVVAILTRTEPRLALESIELALRHGIAWQTGRDPAGRFRVEVRRREESAPVDLVDVLQRDHRALDLCLAQALARVNAGDAAAAKPLVAQLAASLRRHIRVENDVLAPRLGGGAAGPEDPLAIMLREHDEILRQVAALEESAAPAAPDVAELGAFVAILSGTLAKHEHREESNLFPRWQTALRALPAADQARLRGDVERGLA
jgi:hemerythrin-like domain-containing protein